MFKVKVCILYLVWFGKKCTKFFYFRRSAFSLKSMLKNRSCLGILLDKFLSFLLFLHSCNFVVDKTRTLIFSDEEDILKLVSSFGLICYLVRWGSFVHSLQLSKGIVFCPTEYGYRVRYLAPIPDVPES